MDGIPYAMHETILEGREEGAKRQGGQEMAARLLFGPTQGHRIFGLPVNITVTLDWPEGEPPAELIDGYRQSTDRAGVVS